MSASELMAKVIEFVKHNNIDITKVSYDDIMKGFFAARINNINEIGEKIKSSGVESFMATI